jgi:hypothetical protein
LKKLAIRMAVMGVVGAGAVVGIAATPAQAAQASPCRAEGVSMYGRYPINHDQRIYQCVPDPFNPRWILSETCPSGTHPEATLTPYYPGSTTVFLAQTTCV